MKILWAHLIVTAPSGSQTTHMSESLSDFPLSSAPRVSDSVGLGAWPENLYFLQVPSWCCWSWDPTWRTIALFPVLTTGWPLSGSSVQFSRSVMSDSLLPRGPKHTRLLWPSSTPGVYSNSCPSSWWCHPASVILCRPLLLQTSIFPSIRLFSNGSALHIRWPKYWSFSFSLSPSNENLELISFRKDWLDLLAVQGTLKSLLQHHSSKASVLHHSAFFIVQLSHPYMTAGKTIALTGWTFVCKVMSLLLNMLSRFVPAFLPRYKRLLISWLQSPSAVMLEPKSVEWKGRIKSEVKVEPIAGASSNGYLRMCFKDLTRILPM